MIKKKKLLIILTGVILFSAVSIGVIFLLVHYDVIKNKQTAKLIVAGLVQLTVLIILTVSYRTLHYVIKAYIKRKFPRKYQSIDNLDLPFILTSKSSIVLYIITSGMFLGFFIFLIYLATPYIQHLNDDKLFYFNLLVIGLISVMIIMLIVSLLKSLKNKSPIKHIFTGQSIIQKNIIGKLIVNKEAIEKIEIFDNGFSENLVIVYGKKRMSISKGFYKNYEPEQLCTLLRKLYGVDN